MQGRSKFMTELIEWGKSLLFAASVGALILVFARPSLIIGPSMEPTFHDREVILVEKVSYILGAPSRGDIIIAQTELPLNNFMNKSVIKRIIGLPGDTITIAAGAVYINGDRYFEAYTKDDYTSHDGHWQVPPDSVFVMGDNRQNSNDSRNDQIGFVSVDDIKGKVYLRVFPFDKIAQF